MKELILADNEIDSVLLGHDQPEKKLFELYLAKGEDEREAMVLALIGKVMVRRFRRAALG
jgi:hypothetical protein